MFNLAVMLPFYKLTDNMVVYRGVFEDAPFSFYISKQLIPDPRPQRVVVNLKAITTGLDVEALQILRNDDGRTEAPINAIVEKVCLHTKTVRYDPRGGQEFVGIGDTYIPHYFLPDPAPKCILVQAYLGEPVDNSISSLTAGV
jgi:hypothetical protein